MIINEFGTGARRQRRTTLNQAIRLGSPALLKLRQGPATSSPSRTRRSATSTSNSDRIFTQLANNKRGRRPVHPGGARHGGDLGRAPRRPLGRLRPPRRLPRTSSARPSQQLGGDRTRLDAAPARTSTPAAPQLNNARARSCRPSTTRRRRSLVGLGQAAIPGRKALTQGRDEIQALRAAGAERATRRPTRSTSSCSTSTTPKRAVDVDAARRQDLQQQVEALLLDRAQGPHRLHRHGGAPQLRLLPGGRAQPVRRRSGTSCTSPSTTSRPARAGTSRPATTRPPATRRCPARRAAASTTNFTDTASVRVLARPEPARHQPEPRPCCPTTRLGLLGRHQPGQRRGPRDLRPGQQDEGRCAAAGGQQGAQPAPAPRHELGAGGASGQGAAGARARPATTGPARRLRDRCPSTGGTVKPPPRPPRACLGGAPITAARTAA